MPLVRLLDGPMKMILRSFLGWLDRKWPDVVVVTQKDYDNLLGRIKYLEGEVTKFNASLGFAGVRMPANGQPATPFQR